MKNVTILFALYTLAICTSTLSAQQVDPEKGGSLPTVQGVNAEGFRFIIGFMKNEESTSICARFGDRDLSRQQIAFASRFATEVRVNFPDGTQRLYTLDPMRVVTVTLNGEEYECLDEPICRKSLEIISKQPISVYCFSSKGYTSDGYLALPVSSWGTEYVTANYYADYYPLIHNGPGFPTLLDSCTLEPRGGEFAIISAEDSTWVTVRTTSNTRSGVRAGVPDRKMLMKGEMWQLEDGGKVRGASDITGSYVTSDKPVGVLSGHVRTGIPVTYTTKDHLIEMLPPFRDLGRRHLVVPFGGRRGGDVVRVIASDPGVTQATVNDGVNVTNLQLAGTGDFEEFIVTRPTVITTDRSVLVAQYSQSGGVDPTALFDPYMVVVTPEEQFANSAVFQTMPDREGVTGPIQFTKHFVTIVCEKSKYSTVTVLDIPLSLLTSLIVDQGTFPGLENDYVWVTLKVPGNSYYNIKGEAKFGGYVYGIGEFDSYGWPIGVGDFVPIIDSLPPVITAEPECNGLTYTVHVHDTTWSLYANKWDTTWGDYNAGLQSVNIDYTKSSNVEVISADPDPWPKTTKVRTATIHIRLKDPTLPGKIRIIARDGSNESRDDTLDLEWDRPAPSISVDSIGFTNILVGDTARSRLNIFNRDASRYIVVDSATLVRGREFQLDTLNSQLLPRFTIFAGDSLALGINFIPAEFGLYYDTLILWIDCLPYRIPLKGVAAFPTIAVDDHDFGTIRKGSTKCGEITITNDGDAPLQIDDIFLSGKNNAYTLDGISNLKLPFWLAPHTDTTLLICFNPTTEGDFPGQIVIRSNAYRGDSVGALVGQSVYPKLSIDGIDFGEVEVGDTRCDSVAIINNGSDSIYLTGVTIAKDMFVDDASIFPRTLGPNDTLWVPICFSPKAEEEYDSFIGADNQDNIEATNRLTGSGFQLLAEIDGHDWGEQSVNSTTDTVVYLRNLNDHAIRVDSVWLAMGDDTDFRILTAVPPSILLDPREEFPIRVRFAPIAPGARSIGIYALTSSRLRPVIQNLLEGFAVQAIPGDEVIHDTSLAYSCSEQISTLLIYNRGNKILTLDGISMTNPDGIASLNAPPPGSQIQVGDDPLEAQINVEYDGFVGTSMVTISWSFVELPGEEFSRTLTFHSASQRYEITASTPPQVDNGDAFNLYVSVNKSLWKSVAHDRLMLTVHYNEHVSRFDEERWYSQLGSVASNWVFTGVPIYDSGSVTLTLIPESGTPTEIDGGTFPPIPFRGYLGNAPLDTFRVDLSFESDGCVLPTSTEHAYSIANICGLNHRLFVTAGEPPVLKEITPNPSNAVGSVEFSIPFEGETTLEMFEANGVMVKRLVEGLVPGGTHTLTLDLNELPSGVYYFRLRYGTFVATQTMVVQH